MESIVNFPELIFATFFSMNVLFILVSRQVVGVFADVQKTSGVTWSRSVTCSVPKILSKWYDDCSLLSAKYDSFSLGWFGSRELEDNWNWFQLAGCLLLCGQCLSTEDWAVN